MNGNDIYTKSGKLKRNATSKRRKLLYDAIIKEYGTFGYTVSPDVKETLEKDEYSHLKSLYDHNTDVVKSIKEDMRVLARERGIDTNFKLNRLKRRRRRLYGVVLREFGDLEGVLPRDVIATLKKNEKYAHVLGEYENVNLTRILEKDMHTLAKQKGVDADYMDLIKKRRRLLYRAVLKEKIDLGNTIPSEVVGILKGNERYNGLLKKYGSDERYQTLRDDILKIAENRGVEINFQDVRSRKKLEEGSLVRERMLKKIKLAINSKTFFKHEGEIYTKGKNGKWYKNDIGASTGVSSELEAKYGHIFERMEKGRKKALEVYTAPARKRRRILYKMILKEFGGLTNLLPVEVYKALFRKKWDYVLKEYKEGDVHDKVYNDFIAIAKNRGVKTDFRGVYKKRLKKGSKSPLRKKKLETIKSAIEAQKKLWKDDPEWRKKTKKKLRPNIEAAQKAWSEDRNSRLKLLEGFLISPEFRNLINLNWGDKIKIYRRIRDKKPEFYNKYYGSMKYPESNFYKDLETIEEEQINDIMNNGI